MDDLNDIPVIQHMLLANGPPGLYVDCTDKFLSEVSMEAIRKIQRSAASGNQEAVRQSPAL